MNLMSNKNAAGFNLKFGFNGSIDWMNYAYIFMYTIKTILGLCMANKHTYIDRSTHTQNRKHFWTRKKNFFFSRPKNTDTTLFMNACVVVVVVVVCLLFVVVVAYNKTWTTTPPPPPNTLNYNDDVTKRKRRSFIQKWE